MEGPQHRSYRGVPMKAIALSMAYNGATGAIPALLIALACRLLLSSLARRRYALPLGLASGFCLGYLLLPDWSAPLVPTRNWHWLPYLALASCLLGGIQLKLYWLERGLLLLLLFAVTAVALTPNWTAMSPPRNVYIVLLSGQLLLTAVLLEPLTRSSSSKSLQSNVLLGAALVVSAALAAMTIAADVSQTYAQLAAIVAGALCGCIVAALILRDVDFDSLNAGFLVLLGGITFIAHLEPQPPNYGLLLFSAAPLGLWAGMLWPISQLGNTARIAIQSATAIGILALATFASHWQN